MRHILKHHWSRHKHHFGLWALSGLILLVSTLWLEHAPSVPTIGSEPSLPLASAQSTSSSQIIKSVSINKVPEKKIDEARPVASSSPSSIVSPTPSAVDLQARPAVVPEPSLIDVSFEFVSSSGATSTFTACVPENASVYEAMKMLSASTAMRFEFQEYAGLGAMLVSINGVANDARAQKFWIYYRNGVAAPVGISSLRLAPHDLITWKYE